MSTLLWPDPTRPAMLGDDTPETMSLAPSSPARAWVERRLRGCAWAAAQGEDTSARTHCPARRNPPPAGQGPESHGRVILLGLVCLDRKDENDAMAGSG